MVLKDTILLLELQPVLPVRPFKKCGHSIMNGYKQVSYHL